MAHFLVKKIASREGVLKRCFFRGVSHRSEENPRYYARPISYGTVATTHFCIHQTAERRRTLCDVIGTEQR